jgi:hypothetical protein
MIQMRKKRLNKKALENNKSLYHQLSLQHTTNIQQIYGFSANPEKSKQFNFNTAISDLHSTKDTIYDNNRTWNSIQQLQPTNLARHNLCKTQQPPLGTKNLLGLGLKFCPVLKRSNPNLKTTMLKLAYKVCTKQYLLENNHTLSLNYTPQLYIKLKNWNPPPASNTTEEKLLREALLDNSKRKHFFRGLTPLQHKTLQELKQPKEFIILPTDKNLGPAVLNRDDYVKQLLVEHLLTNAYQNIPATTANNRLNNTKQNFLSLSLI